MKSTIIFLGLATLSFNNIVANELKAQDLVQQDSTALSADNTQQQNQWVMVNNENANGTLINNGEEAIIFNPNSVIQSAYSKTMEEVINENKVITETKEEVYQPVVLEMTLEDKIAENNQIVESNIDNEVYPLDFEKINRTVKCNKITNNNMALTVDLKL